MNPLTLIGAGLATAALAYTHFVAYSAGQHKVQAKWDSDVKVRQAELSEYKDKLVTTERQLTLSQKEVQNVRAQEDAANAKVLALQRARVTATDRGLRDANAELAKRLAARDDDSAALAECKTAGSAYRSVLDRCVQEYQQLGDRAQVRLADAVASGLECERSYDAAERALRGFSSP